MTPDELISKLKSMRAGAPTDDRTTMIHLFGILYADELKKFDPATRKHIAEKGTGKHNYSAEFDKMFRLAKYVDAKKHYQNEFK